MGEGGREGGRGQGGQSFSLSLCGPISIVGLTLTCFTSIVKSVEI